MRRKPITIFGGGVAGLSAAQILTRLAHPVAMRAVAPPRSRCVALNGAALFLLERIWGPALLHAAKGPVLERRILSWDGMEPAILDDQARVVDVAALASQMRSALKRNELVEWDDKGADGGPDIIAARSDGRGHYLEGGARQAVQAQVLLRDAADAWALHVETVESGWLVLLPVRGREAVLMGVALGENIRLDALLGESRYSCRAVAQLGPSSPPSSAAPSLFVSSRAAGAAMRIGDAAMRFDPISGDGIAGALRGAHLAALVLDRRARGADPCAIYAQRLARAMRAHLGGLMHLYGAAPLAKSWWHELQAMRAMDLAIGDLWPADSSRFAVTENSLAVPLST